ncbi:MAG: 16S rRNA (guanine(966)-N(2))-methyltransferase RsmD [Bacillota bacterium]
MRITGGSAKGTRLKAPPGRGTRPTPAMVREAIFDILGAQVPGGEVLDLFAGSGSLGIEALSRGASRAVFVEESPLACRIIKENLESTGFRQRARVLVSEVSRALRKVLKGTQFDLVFVDPPYNAGSAVATLETLGSLELVKAPGSVVLEHSAREVPPDGLGGWRRWRHRRYGDTGISIYRSEEMGLVGRDAD